MLKQLNKLRQTALAEIQQSLSLDLLKKLETKYLGRKGELTKILRQVKDLSAEKRPQIGRLANKLKTELQQAIAQMTNKLTGQRPEGSVNLDPTTPGQKIPRGHLHPISQFIKQIEDVFGSMGFEVFGGSEVETEEYNFNLLNFPKNHPARDIQDTFYIQHPDQKIRTGGKQLLLRTQTSPMQIRIMEKKKKPPVRSIVLGRCFRHEATDAGHETTFYQCEGLVIDKKIRITDLIGILQTVLRSIFGKQAKIRVRPSYFPFVEPGLEVDMGCLICGGKGCPACKQKGWMEMLGAGMVHPNVLKNMAKLGGNQWNPQEYSGFAFGMGIERLAMLYYGVDDIRLFYSGDLKFLKQF